MNKRNLSVILVLALGIIFQTTFAFAQDSAKSKSSEEFTALKKGNFVLESDHDVYAAIYMQHGVWYYSATGPVRLKIGKETKELNEGYNQKL